jgi:hypothetical protein
VDPVKLQNYWDRGESRNTLLELMTDYVRHLKEHIASLTDALEKAGD